MTKLNPIKMYKVLNLKQLKIFVKSQCQHQVISYPQPLDIDIISSCTISIPEKQEAADTEEIVFDIPQEHVVLCTEFNQWAIWELEGYTESRPSTIALKNGGPQCIYILTVSSD